MKTKILKIKYLIILIFGVFLIIPTFASNVINIEKSSPIIGEIGPTLSEAEKTFYNNLSLIINSTPTVIELKNNIKSSKQIPTISFGSYVQKWPGTKKQEIKWYILEKREDRAILLSKNILDLQKYHTKELTVNWMTSSIHKWLNDKFFTEAFTPTEKKFITTNPYRNVGLISIPSYTDTQNYFMRSDSVYIDDVVPSSKVTRDFKKEDGSPEEYWLYNNELSNTANIIINKNGETEERVVNDTYGVRPMIIIKFIPDEKNNITNANANINGGGVANINSSANVLANGTTNANANIIGSTTTDINANIKTNVGVNIYGPTVNQENISNNIINQNTISTQSTPNVSNDAENIKLFLDMLRKSDMTAPVFVKEATVDSFIYSFYDDFDNKRASQVKLRIPVISSSNQLKSELMNNLLKAFGIEAIKNSIKIHVDEYYEKSMNVTYGDIEEKDYNTYKIPFTANGMYICNLWFDLVNLQCYAE